MKIKTPRYDLEDRTLKFAKRIHSLVNRLPKTITNIEISKQIVRSSGSIGANYIEANEALSKKDFMLRIKISRKEAAETRYWLRLINQAEFDQEILSLINESTEVIKIFGAILTKSKAAV